MKRSTFDRRYHRRRFHLPPLLVMMIGLVFIFANPVATIASVSSQAPVADQRAGDTAPTEEVATEEPPVEATEDPGGFPTGTLILSAYDCGNSFDGNNSFSANDLFNSCLSPAGVSFDITDSQGTPQSGDGSFSVAAGTVQVTQGTVNGYVYPYVSCDDGTFGQLQDWSTSVEVPQDGTLTCTFFNLAIPPTDVLIHKWTCPDAYDWQAQGADVKTDCTEGPNGITFVADGPNGYHAQTDTGDSQPNAVMFGGLAAGDYTFAESAPDGVDSAFVWSCAYDGELSAVPSQPMSEGFSLNLSLYQGGTLNCDWFNVPADSGGNSVTVYKWLCPEGFDSTGATQEYLLAECSEQHVNIPITLTDDSGDHATTTQSDGTEWDDVAPRSGSNDVQIAVEEPDGFGDPIVYCAPLDFEGDWPQIPSGGATISLTDFGSDTPWTIQCNWFNIPTSTDGNSVTVYKWLCPEGTEYGQASDYYSAACDQEHLNLPITLTDDNGDHATTTQANGTEFDDVVVDQNGLAIAIEEPDGFGDPVVFCGTLDQDDTTLVDSTNGEIHPTDFGSDTPWTLQCFWYNIPTTTDTGNTVTVYKYDCPAGTGHDLSADEYDQQCTQEMTGIPFTLIDDRGNNDATSQAGGTTWSDVQPDGGLTISESVPSGYENPEVFCQLNDGSWEQQDAHNEAVSPETDSWSAPWTWTCRWYNIPEYDGTPTTSDNSVTVYKWLCPEGTDPNSTQEYLGATCDQEHLNIPITLTDANGDHATTTQANGTEWDSVVPIVGINGNLVQIQEEIPTGFGDPVVFCAPLDEDTMTQLPAAGGGIIIENFGADSPWSIQCNWYNIPSDEGRVAGPYIDIHYWECPQGTDFATITDGDLATTCTGQSDGVIFNATSGAAYNQTAQTGSAGPSAVSFAGLPVGQLSVKQVTPPLQLIIICGSDDVAASRLPITQATIQWNVVESEHITCEWYVIPLQPGTVTVLINKHQCPPGYDLSGKTEYDLAAECHDTPSPVDFTVTAPNSYSTTKTVQPAPDYGSWDDVPGGMVTVTEALPTGYDQPVVYCKVEDQLGNDIVPTYKAQVGSAAISASLSDTQVLWCDWFNMPTGGGNSVTVYKWLCPEGIDLSSATLEYLLAECSQEHLNIPITLTDDNGDHATTTQANGTEWDDVTVTTSGLTITEEIPDGFGDPWVYCGALDQDTMTQVTSTGGVIHPTDFGADVPWTLQCNWFNIPDPGSEITIVKFECPEGTTYDHDDQWYADNCSTRVPNVNFRLTTVDGVNDATTDGDGEISWTGVPTGDFTVQEYIEYPYGEPVVVCGFSAIYNGAAIDGFPQRVDAPGGYFSGSIAYPDTQYFCYWYNIPGGPGEITIYKYWCDEGYDYNAYGADPYNDCTKKANGITFTADGPDSYHSQSDTGDSVDSGVYFGGLEPGDYTIVETVPDNTQYVFVLDCYGQWQGQLRPYPLSMGNSLSVSVHSGESVTCYWYNVPHTPKGKITVYKYLCSTKTYVSDVDCEIYEGGATFDLVMWNGSNWVKVDTKTTNGGGMIVWGGVEPGAYWLDEHNQDWCRMTSPQISEDGNWINVYDGQETVIYVYNCGGKPGNPGKTPTKYPNTGVPPQGGSGSPTSLPGAAVVGLLGLALNRRKVLGILGIGGAGILAREVVAQGTQVIDPTDGTPSVGGTPASLCLEATPSDATPEGGGDCFRGPVPTTLKVEAIGVDAPVEILETVGGVMQQPSDENHVAWYKETARLGETGNILIAGHLNWWGVPEAVFYNLGTLKAGDKVTLLDEAGAEFDYVIEWVRQESNLEPPSDEALGMTSYQAVTLMTCGGQWDSSISEYDERTVARGRREVAEAA